MSRIEHTSSYYAATATVRPENESLQGERTCDVCVVGAGFAGMSTALHLAEKGYKVIVLEAARIGYGASGRNGGQVVNGFSRGYDSVKTWYGEDTARALLNMSFEGANIIRERIQKYNIQCDYKPGGFFSAMNKNQMSGLEHEKKTWENAGHTGLELFDAARIPEVVDTNIYCGGLLDKWGGHIHPLNLVLGQAAAFEKLGGVIFEQSRAMYIEKTARPAVITQHGRVFADKIVICGNAYLADAVPELSSRIMPCSSQIVVTEVLGDELTRKMLPTDYCVEDCNYLLDYYRITADKRLLFGGGVIYSGYEPEDVVRRIWPHVLKTFPYLKGRKVEFAWNGQFALTFTRMPHIGRLNDSVYFIQGDSGHGVTSTHLLGKLVAEAINKQQTQFDVFAGMTNFPIPGGRMFRLPYTVLGAWYYTLRDKLGI